MPRDKYNCKWDDKQDDLMIELSCIAAGGKWVDEVGDTCGLGYFEHYMNARKLLWPNRYRHKWTDRMYEEFIRNDITILMGCASSQKTSHAAEFVLMSYWARADRTMVILSTTTIDKLDSNVWGEIKMLWKSGKERYPWLAGHLLEHRHAITTDELKKKGNRDLRCGIVGKACILQGQLIDTVSGKKPIEQIEVGDVVVNAAGLGYVTAKLPSYRKDLVRIHLDDGRSLDCTSDHLILTARGWRNAIDLETFDVVFSASETLSILREEYEPSLSEQEVLFGGVREGDIDVQSMWKTIPSRKAREKQLEIVQLQVCDGLSKNPFASESNAYSKMSVLRGRNGFGAFQSPVLLAEMQGESSTDKMPVVQAIVHSSRTKENETISFLRALLRFELEHVFSKQETKKTYTTNSSRDGYLEFVPGSNPVELSSKAPTSKNKRGSKLVQSRHRVSRNKTGSRIRRALSRTSKGKASRSKEGSSIIGTRVVRVEILESRSLKGYSKSKGGYPVYDLEVGGHPSFSVNGVIVHNCQIGQKWIGVGAILAGIKQEYVYYLADEVQFMQPSFLESWPNLFSNPNVKIIGSGNPQHDPDDQLGIAAEPKVGWTQMPVPEKTISWETMFMGGRCLNLVGTDSPNFDVPEGEPEPYYRLIGRKFANRIIHDYRENSPKYYTQIKGVMRIDMADQRVITRQVCREHGAQELPTWAGTKREKCMGLDPSYGGGDDCVATFLEWGKQDDGKDRVAIVEQKNYFIDVSKVDVMSAEVQIAKQVKQDLEARGMKPIQCAYDPYGKGTMGFAFSQVFGDDVPIPVDSGGLATERPVREGLYVDEANGTRRPVTCREYYSKFVTEAWFSVRYLIEANQLRGLPTDCMMEGCARKYETVAGNKISVESKDDYKERAKHSPNKFDSLAVAVERARQMGLVIDKLGSAEVRAGQSDDWFDKEAKEYEELIQGGLLNHTGRRRDTSLNLYG